MLMDGRSDGQIDVMTGRRVTCSTIHNNTLRYDGAWGENGKYKVKDIYIS